MKIEGDELIFSTGKKVYANNGIIGISPDLGITEGYDGGIETEELTPDEKAELADYAVAQWTKWRYQ